jgi:hypothetical protein
MPSNAIGCFFGLRRKKPKPELQSRSPFEQTQVVPSSSAFAFEAGKQRIQVLQRFGNMLPCANEDLELALLLMTTYEVKSSCNLWNNDLNGTRILSPSNNKSSS